MSLNDTPRADRLHIGLFGNRNSGKSSLINALTGQDIAIVSDTPGTTADPVYKAMELHGIGPVVFIDTAGLDDVGELGKLRVDKSRYAMNKTDVAILVIDGSKSAVPASGSIESKKESSGNSIDSPNFEAPNVVAPYVLDEEKKLYDELIAKDIPVIVVINKMDELPGYLAKHLKNVEKVAGINIYTDPISEEVKKTFSSNVIYTNTKTGEGIPEIRNAIIEAMPEDVEDDSITGDLAKENDHVLLVMPQDSQAPKGRIILPQVQVLRELLDKKCVITCVTTDKLNEAFDDLKKDTDLIITDSQVFKTVYENKPAGSKLTSFSVLMAGYKGDMKYFIESAKQIDKLNQSSKVLIAEACTHAPLTEDIGREQIPAMIKKRIGSGVTFEIVAGDDFPDDLEEYDLVITCGACMFNKKSVLHRVKQAKSQDTPMTNYGIAIAYMNGILDKISY